MATGCINPGSVEYGAVSTSDRLPLLDVQNEGGGNAAQCAEICPYCRRTFESEKTSNSGTLIHLLKANVGTGILAMPVAISYMGMMTGLIGLVVLGIICIYCMHMLVECSKKVSERLNAREREEAAAQNAANPDRRHEPLDYANTAEHAFALGPECSRCLAPWAKGAVNTFLVITQFGFCCVYLLFVADSLHEVSVNMEVFTFFSSIDIMCIVAFIMIFFNFIPDLKHLTGVSSTAVVLQVIGLLMMLYYFLSGKHSDSFIPYVAPVDKWPLYFGTAMYAFEGIGVVLPLENAMENPNGFRGWFGVLNRGMTLVVVLYLLIGSLGYWKYGANVRSSITFNLPIGCFSEDIRIMFALAIFLSYPLQMYVPYTFLLPFLKRNLTRERWTDRVKYCIELAIRATFVIITFALAAAIPMLDLFISLVGAFASSFLALIFPPIIQIILIWNDDNSRSKICKIVFGALIMALGIFGMSMGTYTAVKEIVQQFGNHTI